MLTIPFISAYLYAFVALFYSALSFIVIGINSKKRLYRAFFFAGMSGSIWCLFNALAINSGYYYSSYFFYMFSIIGYVLFYPIVLHICKIFLDKKRSLLFLVLNYLPSIIVLISGIVISLTLYEPINIVTSNWGFSFYFNQLFTRILYSAYFIIYSILIIYNFKDIFKKSTTKKYSKYSKFIAITYILVFIQQIFIELILNNFYATINLYFSSLLYIIPLFLFSIVLIQDRKKYFINDFGLDASIDKGSKRGIFGLLSLFYIVLGFSNLLLDVMITGRIQLGDITGLIIFIIIALVHVLFIDAIEDEKYQNIFLFITAILVEAVVLVVYKDFFAINIWTLIFLYVILMSIFEKSVYIYLTLCIVLLINTIFMIRVPIGVVWFSESNHLMRTIIFVMLFIFVIYINAIFRKRREEIKIGYETRKVIGDFLEGLLSLTIDNIDDKILVSLEELNSGFGFIRSSYFRYADDSKNSLESVFIVERSENEAEQLISNKEILFDYDNTIFSILPKYLDRIKAGEKLYLPELNIVEDITDDIKNLITERGIEGFFAFPVFLESKLKSIIVFEFCYNVENKFIPQYEPIIKNIIIEMIKKLDREKNIFIKNNYDSATNLMKKDYFRESTEKILLTTPGEYYLIYIGILNFEFINKYIGHFNSDPLLKNIADKLKSIAGENITRVSSGDFVVFIETSENELNDIINEIRAKIKAGIRSNKDIFKVDINFGVAKVEDSIEEALNNASIAVQKLNHEVIKDIQFYDEEIKHQVQKEQCYAKRLETALKNDEFSLHFQPQVDVKTEKIIGAECLLRWNVDDIGYIAPYIFIPILEKTGYIIDVGYWIIEEAMQEAINLKNMGYDDLIISINLSPIQFLDKNLKYVIKDLSDKYAIDNDLIEFELTESVAINEYNVVLDLFKEIKDMGFNISIDDFGTGYSSLNRLQYFPIDRLKIDKSFIDGIGIDRKKESVVEIILELSKKLNLMSIAEGVEEKTQVEYLKRLACDQIQGYYYAKPMPKEQFEDFIKQY